MDLHLPGVIELVTKVSLCARVVPESVQRKDVCFKLKHNNFIKQKVSFTLKIKADVTMKRRMGNPSKQPHVFASRNGPLEAHHRTAGAAGLGVPGEVTGV